MPRWSMPRPLLEWGGGYLPSHLTMAQASRFLGVTRSAVSQRCSRGLLPVVPILGVPMVPTAALLQDAPSAVPFASTPSEVLAVAEQAALAIAGDRADAPLFSPLQLAGVYLGLSRLPWPTLSPEVPNV